MCAKDIRQRDELRVLIQQAQARVKEQQLEQQRVIAGEQRRVFEEQSQAHASLSAQVG